MQDRKERYSKPTKTGNSEDSFKNRRRAESAGFNSGARPRRDKQQKPYEKNQRTFENKKRSGEAKHSLFESERDMFEKQQKPFDGKNRPFESKQKSYEGRQKSFDSKQKPFESGQKSFDSKQKPFESRKKPFERKQKSHDDTFYGEPGFAEQEETASDKLEGRNSVLEALKSDRAINRIMIAKGAVEGSIRQIISTARAKGIVVQEVDKSALDKIASTRAHQGVIAFASVKDYASVDDILELAAQKGEPPFIAILDGITDPHNLGAIIRTADAAGVHGIIIPKRRAIGLTPVVSKASAGAVEYIAVARVPNISQTIEYLKTKNIWVVGTDSTGERAYHQGDLKGAIALVIGGEGEGMGKLVREKCDFVVNIPMKGRISSLNASVAAGIVMYEVYKQRGQQVY